MWLVQPPALQEAALTMRCMAARTTHPLSPRALRHQAAKAAAAARAAVAPLRARTAARWARLRAAARQSAFLSAPIR